MAVFTGYNTVRTAMFALISVEKYYRGGIYQNVDLAFSDHMSDYDIDGVTYTALGNLVNIAATNKELNVSTNTVSIQISGIPDQSVEEILKSDMKGSPVTLSRAFFDDTGVLISDPGIANPVGRYKGFVNSYAMNETWDVENRMSTFTVTFECTSFVDMISRKVAGRRTNPNSMKKFYPSDVSFDNTPAIAKASINFGEQS